MTMRTDDDLDRVVITATLWPKEADALKEDYPHLREWPVGTGRLLVKVEVVMTWAEAWDFCEARHHRQRAFKKEMDEGLRAQLEARLVELGHSPDEARAMLGKVTH